ncbi:MAG: ABC-type transport auxiliary lipoprotein family protein [Candidatus Thiodiazotropha sp.]
MMQSKAINILWYGGLGFFFLLTGCFKSPQVAFYTLNSQAFVDSAPENISNLKDITVGIGSVEIPEYLDRPQIVTLKGPHRLHLAEFHRWAGRLNNEMMQVVRDKPGCILSLGPIRDSTIPRGS